MSEINENPFNPKLDKIDQIEFVEILNSLYQKKIQIALFIIFFSSVSIIYAIKQVDIYKSEAVLTIADNQSNAPQISGSAGIASMMGLSLSNNSQNKSEILMQTIRSREFLKHLIEFEAVLPGLMAATGYDQSTEQIIYDSEIYDSSINTWLPTKNKPSDPKPSYLEAHKEYLKHVSISHVESKNLFFMSVEHPSPIFAKNFLDLIINEADEMLRAKDLQESSDAISFLTSEIPKSSLVSMKDAINQLVQSKLETQMMARISSEYIVKIIEPPFIPEFKSAPNRMMIVFIGTIFGILIPITFVILNDFLSWVFKKKISN